MDAVRQATSSGAQEKATQASYQVADNLAASSAKDDERAKEGLNAAGRFAVDLSKGFIELGIDGLTGKAFGNPVPLRALGTFGSNTQEARQAGATFQQQMAYGAGSAGADAAMRTLLNISESYKKIYGEGPLNKMLQEVVDDLSKTARGRMALSAFVEGGKSLVESEIKHLLRRATYDEDARFDTAGAVYNVILSSAMGAITGAFSPAWKAEQEMQEGVVKPQDSDTIKTIEVSLPKNRAQIMHIFRADDGHLTDTPENRTRLLQLAQDSQYRLGVDIHGNIWHAKLLEDGSQLWVEYRDGVIREGGLNLIPHEWDDETGLNNNPKKNGTWRKKEKS